MNRLHLALRLLIWVDVQENVRALTKQLEAAEDRLAAVDIVTHPEARYEESLPLTEITEELDEDGNVICQWLDKSALSHVTNYSQAHSISTPGDSSKRVVEALRKAGVKDLPIPRRPEIESPFSAEEATLPKSNGLPDTGHMPAQVETSSEKNKKPNTILPISESKSAESLRTRKKKGVSFTQDTKAVVLDEPISSGLTTTKMPSTSFHNEIPPQSTIPHEAEVLLESQDADDSHRYIDASPNESPEDAALRRQMLQYSMNEVGAIVAEMDLEESDSMTDYSEEADEDHSSDPDEEEDQFGRTTRRVIDDNYRRQMLELEQKLNAKVVKNVGPNPDTPAPEGINRDTVSLETDAIQTTPNITDSRKRGAKKSVRFAESLDISEISGLPTPSSHPAKTMPSDLIPIMDTVIERDPSGMQSPSPMKPTRRQSKFKTSQKDKISTMENENNLMNDPSTVTINLATPSSKPSQHPVPRQAPTGPLGLTHAATLIERPSASTSNDIIAPDEYDPALMQQSLATEYHRMRNRMIQRSGGFLASEEEPAEEPIENPEQPAAKRVSLFKRARLG